jgi:hypothetical protein
MDAAAGVLGIHAEKAQSQASHLSFSGSFSERVCENREREAGGLFMLVAGSLTWRGASDGSCLQGRHLRILFIECRQPVRRAYELGIAAAAVLAASHAIANAAGGCACSCSGDKLRRASPNRQMASFALVLTWYVRGIPYSNKTTSPGNLLFRKINKSRKSCSGHRKPRFALVASDYILNPCRVGVMSRMVLVVGVALLVLGALPNRKNKLADCGVARHRFLSIGGVLCFAHALFCVVYYASASAAAREERRAATHG